MDNRKNFSYGTVLTAPTPAASGTELILTSGHGARFPDPAVEEYNLVVKPFREVPTLANSEIVRVTALTSDTFTIVREQESSDPRTIVAGDEVFLAITKKILDDQDAIFETEHDDDGTHSDITVAKLNFGEGAELTIDTDGEITVTHSYHQVDTFEDAGTDDLDTINGGAIGDILILQTVTSARVVTVKHVSGLRIGSDFVMTNQADKIVLFKAATGWTQLSRSDNL